MSRTLNIFVILLVLDLAAAGVLWFEYSKLETMKAKETALRGEIADETKKAAEAANTRRMFHQAKKESEGLAKYFFDAGEESQIRFVTELETLGASTSGAEIKVRSFNYIPGSAPAFRGDLEIDGSWSDIYYYLRLIETYPARVVINRFSVSAVKNADWAGAMNLDIMGIREKK